MDVGGRVVQVHHCLGEPVGLQTYLRGEVAVWVAAELQRFQACVDFAGGYAAGLDVCMCRAAGCSEVVVCREHAQCEVGKFEGGFDRWSSPVFPVVAFEP